MRTAILCLLVPALHALAQPLYSNASANPATPALGLSATSLSGTPAPGGYVWSEAASGSVSECNAIAGFSGHAAHAEGHFRFADDFTVTGTGWTLSALTVYAYQSAAAGGLTSPFSGINVRIWNGPPGITGSSIVFGDTTTNRMTSSVNAGIYRIFNTVTAPLPPAPDTTRPVWATTASLGVALPPGTYWIDWQYTTVSPNGSSFTPPAVVPGVRGVPGWNAMQYRPTVGEQAPGWFALVDSGKPWAAADVAQDLPFLLSGVPTPACDPDYNQDGNADQDDVAYLLNVVAGGDNPTGRDPDFNQDGNIDQDDYAALISVVAGGPCP